MADPGKDPAKDSLLREIDEDLRRERYAKLWARYGNVVIGAAVLLVVSVAGYEAWRSYDKSVREEAGARFINALELARSDPAEAEAAFRAIATDAGGGYAILARLHEAALASRRGDKGLAADLYQRLADETSDPLYRDLAVLLSAVNAMDREDGAADPTALQERLAPLTDAANPWRHSAREVAALLALEGGDRERARELFAELSNDPAAPPGLRSRAADMLATLRGG